MFQIKSQILPLTSGNTWEMDYNWIIIFLDGGDSEEGFCISRKFDPRTLLFGLNYFFLSLIVFPVCTNMCADHECGGI